MENVQLTIADGIAVLVIDRPKQLNALNKQTLSEINEAFESMRDDDAVKVVIMTTRDTGLRRKRLAESCSPLSCEP